MEEKDIRTKIEKDFKYADLTKYEWFWWGRFIVFTNNIDKPMISKETWWSYILRMLKLKKNKTFGKPKEITYIEETIC